MKILPLAVACCGVCLTPLVSADTIFGVYAGAGVWQTDFDGDASDTGQVSIDLDDLGIEDESSNMVWLAVEHPIPILPNVRLQSTDISVDETGTLTVSTTVDGTTFTNGEQVDSTFDLTHTDVTLYYEVLDNWLNLDIGLTARIFDGEISLTSLSTNNSATLDLDAPVPMLYIKSQIDLPFTGFYVMAAANGIGYSGNTLTDFVGALGYQSDGWVMDLGVEVGVRNFNLELDDLDDIDAEIDLSGAYAAFTLHF